MKKNFKKFGLLVAAATIATSAFAGPYGNTPSAGDMRFGVTTGVNISNQKKEFLGFEAPSDAKAGFKLGVVGEYYLSDMFFLAPELQFSMKGSSMESFDMGSDYDNDYDYWGLEDESSSDSEKAKETINYLQLPINVGIKYNINNDLNISAFTGPYFAVALGGKTKIGDEKEDFNFGSSIEDNSKRFDFGWNIGAGIEFKSVFFKINYELGLSNLSPISDFGKVKNRNFALSVGYMF